MQKITTQLAAGNPPDIVKSTSGSRIGTYAAAGVLEPVDDIVDAIGRADYFPNVLRQFVFDDVTLAVPDYSLAMVCWYRKDMAEQSGLKPPSNWDELLAFAKANTRDGVYGMCLPVSVSYVGARMVLTFFRQNGGDVVDEDLKVAVDSPQNKEALAFMKELFQYSPPGSANYMPVDQLTSFTTGAVAITYYEGRPLGRIMRDKPELMPLVSAVPLPYKTTPFNHGEPKGAIIFNQTQNRELAKKWILEAEFSEPNHVNWLLVAPSHMLPVRQSVADNPRFNDFPLIRDNKEIVDTLKEQNKNSGNFRYPSINHKSNPKGGAIDTSPILPTMLQRYLLNNESAESVLAWGQKEITNLMDN
jgi:multiple sugar transport system substrate-binding protein